MPDLSGHSFGRYTILEQLGEGGMATVYKAFDTRLERDVAVKIIRTEQFAPAVLVRILKRFEREAKALARLSHPNIVKVHDFGEHEGAPYLVMEYLSGGTLKQKLGMPLPWREALRLLQPVAEALGYAHEHAILHRDVKPSNILLAEKGQPMLTDFGIAKILDLEEGQTLTATGVGIGTPEYMSPEQGMGKPVNAGTDIYSLGVVLYELLTGRKPFTADTPMAVVVKHLTDPLPRPGTLIPDLPEAVEKMLLKALAKNPEDRYSDMNTMAQAMEGLRMRNGHLAGVTENSNKKEKREVPPQTQRIYSEDDQSTLDQGLMDAHSDDRLRRTVPDEVPRPQQVPGMADPGGLTMNKKRSWLPWVIGSGLVVALLAGLYAILQPGGSTTSETPSAIAFDGTTAAEFTGLRPQDGMQMVYIDEGEFLMGSLGDTGDTDEHPQRSIFLSAYWIDSTEVTNAMYALCVQAGGCQAPLDTSSYSRSRYYGDPTFNDHPVVNVTWNEAQAYCAWAGARLPTEAEWEKAARYTAGQIYPWGQETPNYNLVNLGGDTTAVGSFPDGSSLYGALDMAGNVREWVADWYGYNYYTYAQQIDPQGAETGLSRVVRGGSFPLGGRDNDAFRAANRGMLAPTVRYPFVGFRCAWAE